MRKPAGHLLEPSVSGYLPIHSMGLPYMPTLTPQTTPTDRHIWHTWSVRVMLSTEPQTRTTASRLFHILAGAPLKARRGLLRRSQRCRSSGCRPSAFLHTPRGRSKKSPQSSHRTNQKASKRESLPECLFQFLEHASYSYLWTHDIASM